MNSSQGGGSKDTWVLAREPVPASRPSAEPAGRRRTEVVPVAERDVSVRDTSPGAGMASQQ